MTVKERLIEFLKHKGLSQAKFAKIIGVSSGFVNAIRVSIQPDKIHSIASNFPELNTEWLLTGEGSMLKPTKDEAVEINPDIMMIPLVSQYAYAGYMSGYGDAEYIETLPTIPVFIDRELKGTYRAFEVRGDSMDDDSRDSICQGDRLVCRQIKPELWQYKFHMRQWNFVIVHKTDGILVKRIIDHDTETGIITLHSLNPLYEDMRVHLNEVAQMFNVIEIHRGGRI